MEALLPIFVATLLAEWGSRSQLLAAALATRCPRGAVLRGMMLAALANAAIAALGGHVLAGLVPHRPLVLITGIALLLAGGGALFAPKPVDIGRYRLATPALASALGAFVQGFGERAQFIIFAMAAWSGAAVTTAIGGALGIVLATLPAILLGDRFATRLPVTTLRLGAAGVLIVAGLIIGLGALRLI